MKPDQIKNICSMALCLALAFPSCKKDEKEPAAPVTAAKQSDQSGASAADSGIEDVNDYINNKIGGGDGKRVAYDLPCGVVSLDSSVGPNGKKIYTFRYGGSTPCGYKYKSGNISFQLVKGQNFAEAGAVSAITFKDYTVKSNATNDIIKVNGTLYTTNVTGGYIWQAIVLGDTIAHRLRGSFITTYANGQSRPRNYSQLRTWASNSGWAGLTFRVTGDTLINSLKVSETGKTYDGSYDYITEISDDFLWANCGSSYPGPYVLKNGTARLSASIPGVSPAYFEISAGYYYQSAQAVPVRKNDCSSNAYRITTVTGSTVKTEYQLY